MKTITIQIQNCKGCPHFKTENQWSSDGWDRMEDWVCSKNGRMIATCVEWFGEKRIEVPDWCPIKVEEKA